MLKISLKHISIWVLVQYNIINILVLLARRKKIAACFFDGLKKKIIFHIFDQIISSHSVESSNLISRIFRNSKFSHICSRIYTYFFFFASFVFYSRISFFFCFFFKNRYLFAFAFFDSSESHHLQTSALYLSLL